MSELWDSLALSMQIAFVATLVTCLIGVPLAFWMARLRFPGKSFVEALIMVPLVLPPTVVGYGILMVMGKNRALGRWLSDMWDYQFIFSFEAAVAAAVVVSLPMLYMPAKAAFQEVDPELEDVSRLLGANRLQMFWHVSLPLARRGILSGMVLAFARAIGEFGATVMVFGNQPSKLTLPISIYAEFEAGTLWKAGPAVVLLIILSLVMIMTYNRSTRSAK